MDSRDQLIDQAMKPRSLPTAREQRRVRRDRQDVLSEYHEDLARIRQDITRVK